MEKTSSHGLLDVILAETAKREEAPSSAYSVTDPNALSAFAKVAHEKLGQRVEQGKARAAKVVEKVMSEIPQDYVRPAKTLRFNAHGEQLVLETIAAAGSDATMGMSLHRHALGQVAQLAEIPMSYVSTLSERGSWGKRLLAELLDETFAHSNARHLVRAVNGQARGVLSDKYRRLDSRPLLEAFVSACQSVGAVPIDGHALDTKVAIKAVLPHVYQPIPNELVVLGIDWENSDYGNGAHAIKFYFERLVCMNGAIGTGNMRQVHVGGRLSEDVAYSNRTRELDTQASASAISDVVKNYLSPAAVEKQLATIKAAHEKGIDPKSAIEGLKARLTKGEVDSVKEAFTSADIVNMPAGQSAWRLSNAISWVANKSDDEERKIELQKVAGLVLPAVA